MAAVAVAIRAARKMAADHRIAAADHRMGVRRKTAADHRIAAADHRMEVRRKMAAADPRMGVRRKMAALPKPFQLLIINRRSEVGIILSTSDLCRIRLLSQQILTYLP
jgi:putative ubiquitin-RnfH superfamily antitoxin RatB of RatAB toxin-antitoxin module